MKKFFKKVNNLILCIRFPFLRITIDEYGDKVKVRNYAIEKKIDNLREESKAFFYEGSEPSSNVVCRIIDEKKHRRADRLEWYYNNLYQWMHFLPEETWLDDMPIGWRKAFGKKICKDIKRQLLRSGGVKALKEYKVEQVKEKFGSLRWYDNSANSELYDIISKYETKSANTCIICGKKATVMTIGWICPYCDKCVPNESKTAKIRGNKIVYL